MHYCNLKLRVLLLVLLMVISVPVFAQTTINVTMLLNTATNPDTLMEHHYVDVRGQCTGANTPGITWDNGTGIVMENIGGDYWKATFQMTAGDTLRYKFWTGFDKNTNTLYNWGWEGSITPANPELGGDTRSFIAGSNDTTLALQFYHGADGTRDQFWRPYETKADTFAVYFRVNMAGLMETGEFDPAGGDIVQVQGGTPLDPDDGWNTPVILTQEAGSVADESFFSGVGYIAKSAVAGGEWQNFKFTYMKNGTEHWESISNRYFQYHGATDTTIYWAFFNNQPPSGGNLVEATLIWQVKTDGLEKLGFFDRTLGETIVIDGAKAWASDLDDAIQMNYVPLLKMWVGQETFKKAPGAQLEYKPVIRWDDSRIDPTSVNYLPGLDLDSPVQYWEESATTGSGNRFYDYTDQTTQYIPGDFGFDYQYFNGLPAEGVIETPVTVTFNIDMTPATNETGNPSNPLFVPGTDSCEISFYGCLTSLSQGFGLYDSTLTIPLKDPDGDLVYTGTYTLQAPTTYAAGYVINYSTSDGSVITNGGGFTAGRMYYQFIRPTSVGTDGTITWPSEFTFPTMTWANSNLTVEEPPDLFTPTAIEEPEDPSVIKAFNLAQNYPNPFNPITSMRYDVPHTAIVNISVYNLMGQLVTTLVNSQQNQGRYTIQWNSKDRFGNLMPSGIYFVKMTAGDYHYTRKLTLVR